MTEIARMTNSPISEILSGTTNSSSDTFYDKNCEGGNDTGSFAYPSWWTFGSYEDPSGIISLRLMTWGLVIPALAVVGIATNALNVAVLTTLIRRTVSPDYRILLAMAFADILIMMSILLDCLLFVEQPDPVLSDEDVLRLRYHWRILHYSLISATNLFTDISNWCTVAMATFRFVAVYFPMKASKWCTRRRATITIAAIVTVTALLRIPCDVLIAHRALSNTSTPDLTTEYYDSISTMSNFLPWNLSFILILLLLINFHKLSNDLSTKMRRHQQYSGRRRRRYVTLISTVVWFVATTAPYTVASVLMWIDDSIYSSTLFSRLICIAQILLLVNYNGNFVFYSFISSSHRKKLNELLRITSPIQRRKK